MKQIENKLQAISAELDKTLAQNKDFRRIKSVWFEAWKYKDEDEILAALIEVIIDSIKEENNIGGTIKKVARDTAKTAGDTLEEKIEKLGSSINYKKIFSLLSKAALKVDITEFFTDGENKKSPTHEDFLSFYDIFKKTFDEILWEYLGVKSSAKNKDEQAALVIFIDDLDRCPLPKIVQILETIKLFMDKQGCIFVLGAAKDIIENAMKADDKYRDKDAEEFLEKIIQINFPLPQKTTDNAIEFINEIKGKLDADGNFDDETINAILPILDLNPRRIIALFNDISLQTGILHQSGNTIEFKKLLLWKTLEKYNRYFFNEIIREKTLYDSFVNDLKVYENSETPIKKDEAQIKEKLENPDLIEYVKDDNVRLLITKMDLTDEEYKILVTHSATFEAEVLEEEAGRDYKDYLEKIEKSRKDAPADYKEFIKIPGSSYNLEGLGEKHIEPFAIGKYLVTNKWFKEFIDAGGYGKTEFWSADGKKWLTEAKVTSPKNWDDAEFNHPRKPVVGISWYDAEAFCSWLSKKSGKKYRLLTEAEWQAAAGGKENRTYAWGTEWNSRLCNNEELGLERTSVVGLFKKGDTPEGICDMSGNAWELTSSKKGSSRVIRGGSWLTDAELCRVAGR
ncbi:SUMF1/EgtB/PvdO family nonheme iron enzyme, partial [bacterium]|nr:SUMF1/EgtB/PvdO family nonheme iron enzyme [bacterium]